MTTPFHTILEKVEEAKGNLTDGEYKAIVEAVATARATATTKRYRVCWTEVLNDGKSYHDEEGDINTMLFTHTSRRKGVWRLDHINEWCFSPCHSAIGMKYVDIVKTALDDWGSYTHDSGRSLSNPRTTYVITRFEEIDTM